MNTKEIEKTCTAENSQSQHKEQVQKQLKENEENEVIYNQLLQW